MKYPRVMGILVLGASCMAVLLYCALSRLNSRFYEDRLKESPACRLCYEIEERRRSGRQHVPFGGRMTKYMTVPCGHGRFKGDLALYKAANTGDIEVLRSLLALGANPNGFDATGDTPLMALIGRIEVTSASRYKECFDLFISHGADVNRQSRDSQQTPLHRAAGGDYAEMIRWLISEGANLEARDKFGETPLHKAAASDSWRSFEPMLLLVELGADCTAKSREGKVPLDLAIDIDPRRRLALEAACKGK